MLECPVCRRVLQLIDMPGRYSGTFPVFRCSDCSGIWGSVETILQMTPESVETLYTEPTRAEKRLACRTKTLACPRCSRNLELIQPQRALPAGLHFHYCTECQGFWFDTKEQVSIVVAFLETRRRNLKRREAERTRKKRGRHNGGALDILNLSYPFSWDIFGE